MKSQSTNPVYSICTTSTYNEITIALLYSQFSTNHILHSKNAQSISTTSTYYEVTLVLSYRQFSTNPVLHFETG